MQYSKANKHLKNTDFNEKLINRGLNAAAFLLLITTAYNIFFGEKNIFDYLERVETKNNLLTQIDQIKKENQDLERKIYLLQNDPFYIEKIARENLGLMKDNEEVYVIVGMKKEQQPKEEKQEERWVDKIKAKYQQFKLQ